jgi:hypothetical protein
LPAIVVVEAHVDEALEIDGRGAVSEPDAVPGEAAVGDASAGSDEPGEAAFDHRSELSVVVGEFAVTPRSAGLEELSVVVGELQFERIGQSVQRWPNTALFERVTATV